MTTVPAKDPSLSLSTAASSSWVQRSSLAVEVGDANGNGTVDVTIRARVGGVPLPPITLDLDPATVAATVAKAVGSFFRRS